MRNKLLLAAAIGALCSGIATPALAASSDDWQYGLTLYAWLPDVNGDLKYHPVAGELPDIELGPNDYLSNINFAFAFATEGHRGDWGFLTDFIYYSGDVGNSKVRNLTGPGGAVVVPINRDTTVDLKDTIFQVAGTYSVMRDARSNLDVLLGFRYYNIDTDLKWSFEAPTAGLAASGKASQKVNIWNTIIGVRGRAQLGDSNWFVPYYLDYGFGNTDSWQGMVGVGYTFGWGDMSLQERYQELNNGDKLIDNLKLNGLMLTAGWHF